MQAFVRDELGDCRSFARDKPALRQPRRRGALAAGPVQSYT
jgi:hypothetical protein